jgi:hypothetical protein
VTDRSSCGGGAADGDAAALLVAAADGDGDPTDDTDVCEPAWVWLPSVQATRPTMASTDQPHNSVRPRSTVDLLRSTRRVIVTDAGNRSWPPLRNLTADADLHVSPEAARWTTDGQGRSTIVVAHAPRPGAYVAAVDVVLEVGGWEHECCGEAIERDQLVDFWCIRYEGPDGQVRLIETHHGGLDVSADERVRGRVVELQVVLETGDAQSVLRVPSRPEMTRFDDGDDWLLTDPWTGEVITSRTVEFLVTVRPSR